MYMTSQSAIKRKRRMARVQMLNDMYKHIDWCKQNVTVRDDDGVEHPVTLEEALQFIIMTSEKKDK